jgi:predicted phage terminase large subunit-like protein
MAISNKSYLEDWEEYAESKLNAMPVDITETAKEKKARIARLEAEPEDWIAYYFNEKYPCAAFHRKATKRVTQNLEWYEVRMWSRELAKSTRTMQEVLYLTLTGKKKYVLMVSNSYDNAVRLLMPYRANLELNPRIKNDYGVQEGPREWTEGEFCTRKNATFRAIGAGQSPRGAKTKKNVRPDVLLFDDVDTDESCRNPEIVKNIWKWIEEAAIGTRSISEPTTIIFCGNRIATDCCVERASKFADKVDTINIVDKNGKSSWPEKNSDSDIKRVLSQKSYASTQKEYFNNPITEGSVFKQMAYKKARPLKEYSTLVCYTDPSFKSTIKNDYKAVVLVGKWKDEYHVIKAFVEQTTTAVMIQWYYEIMRLVGDRSCYFLIEEVFLSELIKTQVYEQTAGGKSIPLTGDKRQKDDKFTRIESLLEPLHRNGKLYLNADYQEDVHMQRLDEQFVAFAPGSRAHDDGPDAVEGAVWIINTKNSAAGGIMLFQRPVNDLRI